MLFAIPLVAQTPAAEPPARVVPTAPPRVAGGGPQRARGTPPPAGFAQTIVLWPGGAPLAQGTAEGDIPKLFTYPTAGAGPHSAVIVMPGGGYTHEVMEQEGAYEARWLAAHGVAAFVLEYRLSPAYEYPAPMRDASRAILYVRSHAAELGVKPGAARGVGILRGWPSLAGMAGDESQGRRSGGEGSHRPGELTGRTSRFISYGRLSMELCR
jgi:acetyl esterase/lipase